jgi:hypothetical protein
MANFGRDFFEKRDQGRKIKLRKSDRKEDQLTSTHKKIVELYEKYASMNRMRGNEFDAILASWLADFDDSYTAEDYYIDELDRIPEDEAKVLLKALQDIIKKHKIEPRKESQAPEQNVMTDANRGWGTIFYDDRKKVYYLEVTSPFSWQGADTTDWSDMLQKLRSIDARGDRGESPEQVMSTVWGEDGMSGTGMESITFSVSKFMKELR